MARITPVQRQFVATTVDEGAVNRAYQTGQTIAGTLSAFASRQERLEIASAKAEVAKANADATRSFYSALENNKLTFGKNPTASTNDFENILNSEMKRISDGLTSERAKSLFSESMINLKNQYQLKHDTWVTTQTTSNVFSNLSSAGESYASQATMAGASGDLNQLREIASNYNDVVIASGDALAPEQISKLNSSGQKQIVENFLYGAITERPDDALDLIESGAFNEMLAPEEILSFEKKAYAEVERQEKIAEEELEAEQESNYFEAMLAIETNSTPPTPDDIANGVRTGLYSADDGEKLIKNLTNPDDNNFSVDVYSSLNKKLADGVLTQREIADARYNREITKSQAQQFIQLMTSRPEANPAFKRALTELDSVIPSGGFLGRTPADETLYKETQAEMLDAIRDGKNPLDLVRDLKKVRNENVQSTQSLTSQRVQRELGNEPDADKFNELMGKYIENLQGATNDSARQQFRAMIKELKNKQTEMGY